MPSTARRPPDGDGLVALHRARFVEWAPSPVVALAATRDGSALAAARDDGALELLDTETWGCVARIPGRDGACLTSLAWVSPPPADAEARDADGDALPGPPPPPALVSAGLDGTLTVWSFASRAPASTTPSGGGAVWCLAVSPDGDRLAAACDDGGVRLFSVDGAADAPALTLDAALPRAPDRALAVAWHPGGRALVTGHADGVLRAWEVARGSGGARGRELFRADAGAGAPLWAVAVLPDGTIATGDGAGGVRLWDAEHGTPVAAFAGAHGADVLALAAAPRGARGAAALPALFSAGADGRVASFVCAASAAGGDAAPAWSAGPHRAPHGGRDARCLALVPPPRPTGRAAAPPPLLASGGNDAHVVVHGVPDFGRAHPARACRAPQAPAVAVAPPPPSTPAAPPALLTVQRRTADLYALGVPARRGDAAGRVSGWGWVEGAPVDVVSPPAARARVALAGPGHAAAAAVGAGGRWIALATAARTALFEVVDSDGGTRVVRTPLPPATPPAAGLAFTPAADRLLIAAPDGGLVVIDIGATPTLAARLPPPPPPRARVGDAPAPTALDALAPPATGVAASPCGRWAAVHGPAGASVFDLAALTALWRPPRPRVGGPLAAAAFDAAGALLLLTAGGGIAAFDVASRAPVPWGGDGQRGGVDAARAPAALPPLPGAAVGLSACPSPGSRRVLVCTPAALCAADLGAPPTPPQAAPPPKRRRTAARGGPAPAPAGANPRPLPLEHACLAAAYVGPGAALLVERAWSDAAAGLPAPVLRPRFGE